MDMENTTATDTTYLDLIAAAITPEWVAELDDHDLARAAGYDGIPVELYINTAREIPEHEFVFGEHAIIWIMDDGTASIWGGRPVDDDGDGPWVHGDTVLIDPAIVAAALEAAA